MITRTARFASACPECKAPIAVGAEIALPEVKNRAGGRTYRMLYCPACAADLEEIGPQWAPCIDQATRAAENARCAKIAERIAARRTGLKS